MRPTAKVKFTPMTTAAATPYEKHRDRVCWMEGFEALRRRVSLAEARRTVARLIGLSPDQLVAIRKRRRKDLVGSQERKIDVAYLRYLTDRTGEFHGLLVESEGPRSLDPRLVAKAKASIRAMEQLIAEAHAAGVAIPDDAEEPAS